MIYEIRSRIYHIFLIYVNFVSLVFPITKTFPFVTVVIFRYNVKKGRAFIIQVYSKKFAFLRLLLQMSCYCHIHLDAKNASGYYYSQICIFPGNYIVFFVINVKYLWKCWCYLLKIKSFATSLWKSLYKWKGKLWDDHYSRLSNSIEYV